MTNDMKTHALLLVLVIVLAPPALAQTTITIDRCYDGDTCTSTEGEKIRLACIDTPELRGKRADPVPAKAARDYLNGLVAGEEVSIRRITKDRYGRTVAELSKDGINIQERLVDKGFASVYQRYADQCTWSKNIN
ncbi:thermonuclease family protein [Prochlorococcus sp. MIT 1300]|uniref:thermonuclease family protein n=1 Tax=Prochlorococcus sp. MIT 1300 TaxID=3096218 RepID=UPI002A75B393|nr:thermonuclease family protein [Prochlorococcus sp. MIT 1300]